MHYSLKVEGFPSCLKVLPRPPGFSPINQCSQVLSQVLALYEFPPPHNEMQMVEALLPVVDRLVLSLLTV